jgi:hypothetical protein
MAARTSRSLLAPPSHAACTKSENLEGASSFEPISIGIVATVVVVVVAAAAAATAATAAAAAATAATAAATAATTLVQPATATFSFGPLGFIGVPMPTLALCL